MRAMPWLLVAFCPIGCAEKSSLLRIESAKLFEIESGKPSDVDTMLARQAAKLMNKRQEANIRICAIRGLQDDKQIPPGTHMEVDFGITPDGRALDVEISTPLFKGTTFGDCVVRILNFIRFTSAILESRQVHLQLALDVDNPFLGATIDSSPF